MEQMLSLRERNIHNKTFRQLLEYMVLQTSALNPDIAFIPQFILIRMRLIAGTCIILKIYLQVIIQHTCHP
jgi:hypothetical protein